MNIGIIGQGFVGNAVYQKFRKYYNVLTYDIVSEKGNSTFDKLERTCRTIFVCLPTPMNSDGSCNVSIIEEVLEKLNYKGLHEVVIKSTIPPDTTARWNEKFLDLQIVFNPEFLTERNAVKDYENQNRIILGGPRPATTKLKRIFSKVFPSAHIIKTDSTHAEMVKYLTNTFLATKVSFANEMYQICTDIIYLNISTLLVQESLIRYAGRYIFRGLVFFFNRSPGGFSLGSFSRGLDIYIGHWV